MYKRVYIYIYIYTYIHIYIYTHMYVCSLWWGGYVAETDCMEVASAAASSAVPNISCALIGTCTHIQSQLTSRNNF